MVLYHIINYNTRKVICETIRRSSTVEKNFGYNEYTDLDERVLRSSGERPWEVDDTHALRPQSEDRLPVCGSSRSFGQEKA